MTDPVVAELKKRNIILAVVAIAAVAAVAVLAFAILREPRDPIAEAMKRQEAALERENTQATQHADDAKKRLLDERRDADETEAKMREVNALIEANKPEEAQKKLLEIRARAEARQRGM